MALARSFADGQDTSLHVGIILDGNGRWARARGLPRAAGHRRGAEVVKEILRGCPDRGIRYLTIYAFSSENWKRPEGEVADLMGLLRLYLRREVGQFERQRRPDRLHRRPLAAEQGDQRPHRRSRGKHPAQRHDHAHGRGRLRRSAGDRRFRAPDRRAGARRRAGCGRDFRGDDPAPPPDPRPAGTSTW